MTAAVDLRVGTVNMVCQISGVQGPASAVEFPYGPSPLPSLPNDTAQYDFFAGDIGVLYDMGDGRVGILFGDCYGSAWRGGFDIALADTVEHRINPAFSSTPVSSFDGGVFDRIITSSVGSWPDPDDDGLPAYISVENNGGPGGWAAFSYGGKDASINAVLSMDLIAGTGTVEPSQWAATGDPRENGGYRGNLLATSTTTDLGAGLEIDTMLTHADGCAIEPFPFEQANPAVTIEDVYPQLLGGPGTTLPIKSIVRTGGYVIVETGSPTGSAVPHGLELGKPKPSGPPVYVKNATSKTTTLTGMTDALGNPTTSTALAKNINVSNAFGFIGASGPSGSSNLERRIAVQTLSGTSIVQYDHVTLTQFVDCTLISGGGFAGAGGSVIQGWDKSLQGTDVTDRDWMIYDVPSTTTFRILNSFAQNRAGGRLSGCVAHLPNITDVADPLNAPKTGLFPVGACSVPHVGATNDRRQVAFVFNSFYNGAFGYGTACETWYSDDGGDQTPWTRSATGVFPAEADQTSLIQGIHPYYDADDVCGFGQPYVVAIAGPAGLRMRILPADILDATAWEFYTGSGWSSDIADAEHVGWTDQFGPVTAGSFSCSLSYHVGQEIWIVQQAGNVRFADTFTGTWGPSRRVTDSTDFPGNGLVYGGWQCHLSGVAPNDLDAWYFAVTILNPYQVFLMKAKIVDPGGVDSQVEHRYNVEVDMPGGGRALGDSWWHDIHPWVRTGNHTFTVTTDAHAFPLGATWLKPGTKVSYNDGAVDYGVVGSVSFAANVTTVNLIPNTSYLMAAATITAPRYSHDATPPGFPSRFVWAPTFGFYTPAAGGIYSWSIDGDGLFVPHVREASLGTKDASATSPTISLPIACKNISGDAFNGTSFIVINGSAQGPCLAGVNPAISGGTVITAYSNWGTANTWSPGNSARIGDIHGLRFPFF